MTFVHNPWSLETKEIAFPCGTLRTVRLSQDNFRNLEFYATNEFEIYKPHMQAALRYANAVSSDSIDALSYSLAISISDMIDDLNNREGSYANRNRIGWTPYGPGGEWPDFLYRRCAETWRSPVVLWDMRNGAATDRGPAVLWGYAAA